jgi:hypothetical protein
MRLFVLLACATVFALIGSVAPANAQGAGAKQTNWSMLSARQ